MTLDYFERIKLDELKQQVAYLKDENRKLKEAIQKIEDLLADLVTWRRVE